MNANNRSCDGQFIIHLLINFIPKTHAYISLARSVKYSNPFPDWLAVSMFATPNTALRSTPDTYESRHVTYVTRAGVGHIARSWEPMKGRSVMTSQPHTCDDQSTYYIRLWSMNAALDQLCFGCVTDHHGTLTLPTECFGLLNIT